MLKERSELSSVQSGESRQSGIQLLKFTLGHRVEVDATNALNVVTYTGVSTIVGSPQFGLPIQANPMRKLQSSLRVRF